MNKINHRILCTLLDYIYKVQLCLTDYFNAVYNFTFTVALRGQFTVWTMMVSTLIQQRKHWLLDCCSHYLSTIMTFKVKLTSVSTLTIDNAHSQCHPIKVQFPSNTDVTQPAQKASILIYALLLHISTLYLAILRQLGQNYGDNAQTYNVTHCGCNEQTDSSILFKILMQYVCALPL